MLEVRAWCVKGSDGSGIQTACKDHGTGNYVLVAPGPVTSKPVLLCRGVAERRTVGPRARVDLFVWNGSEVGYDPEHGRIYKINITKVSTLSESRDKRVASTVDTENEKNSGGHKRMRRDSSMEDDSGTVSDIPSPSHLATRASIAVRGWSEITTSTRGLKPKTPSRLNFKGRTLLQIRMKISCMAAIAGFTAVQPVSISSKQLDSLVRPQTKPMIDIKPSSSQLHHRMLHTTPTLVRLRHQPMPRPESGTRQDTLLW